MTTYLIISDFNTSPFSGYLRSEFGENFRIIEAPVGPIEGSLMPNAAHWKYEQRMVDCAVVWTRPESISSQFSRCAQGDRLDVPALDDEVFDFINRLDIAAKTVRALWVPLWTHVSHAGGLGVGELKKGSLSWAIYRMNSHLIERGSRDATLHVLDTQYWLAQSSRTHDPKLWLMGKIPFSNSLFRIAAKDIVAGQRVLDGANAKLVVVDLDDTLWGGSVGEMGWQNLVLGGHDHVGEAYIQFQRVLKVLSKRGVMLAIASRNNELVALQAIDKHPEMVLSRKDFIGWEIHWGDKAESIVSLTRQLNIGLEHVVFIDDHPAERARVREALPDVIVPEWPSDPTMFADVISDMGIFHALEVSDEDRTRTKLYSSESQRQGSQSNVMSMGEWLATLDLNIVCQSLDESNISRATQLLNKTNQMNLRNRRMSKDELAQWNMQDENECWVFRSIDRFGDSGLIGLLSLTFSQNAGYISDYLLSCRVLGRGIEQTLLHVAALRARKKGCIKLNAECVPSDRNMPCRELMQQLLVIEDSSVPSYSLDPIAGFDLPVHVTLQL